MALGASTELPPESLLNPPKGYPFFAEPVGCDRGSWGGLKGGKAAIVYETLKNIVRHGVLLHLSRCWESSLSLEPLSPPVPNRHVACARGIT